MVPERKRDESCTKDREIHGVSNVLSTALSLENELWN